MKHFKKLSDLPKYEGVWDELRILISAGLLDWDMKKHKEICLTSTYENSTDIFEGASSLHRDWSKVYEVEENGSMVKKVPLFENPKKESDFKYLCNQFEDTVFEEIYAMLWNYVGTPGRIKIFVSTRCTCLSWHVDDTPRIHFPMKTQKGCFMVIDDEVMHMKQDNWYWANTTIPHTAFNASDTDRIHLVASMVR